MPQTITAKPSADEYAPYYGTYIAKVPEGNLLALLSTQIEKTSALLHGVPESDAGMRYAPGKWSIKEVIGHVIDTERIMSYRALRIARGDATPLPGFEQDDYVRAANFDARTLADLTGEFREARGATISLFRSLDEVALTQRGTANNVAVSVRALAYIIAGHERHHVQVLQMKYLKTPPDKAARNPAPSVAVD